MAYQSPKIILTMKTDECSPARCPGCGQTQIMLFLATDVARCSVCGRAWHPSDTYYATPPAAQSPVPGTPEGVGESGRKRRRRRRRRRSNNNGTS